MLGRCCLARLHASRWHSPRRLSKRQHWAYLQQRHGCCRSDRKSTGAPEVDGQRIHDVARAASLCGRRQLQSASARPVARARMSLAAQQELGLASARVATLIPRQWRWSGRSSCAPDAIRHGALMVRLVGFSALSAAPCRHSSPRRSGPCKDALAGDVALVAGFCLRCAAWTGLFALRRWGQRRLFWSPSAQSQLVLKSVQSTHRVLPRRTATSPSVLDVEQMANSSLSGRSQAPAGSCGRRFHLLSPGAVAAAQSEC